MAEEAKLKQCPNCGESSHLVVDKVGRGKRASIFVIRCSYCGVTGPNVYSVNDPDISKRAAGEAWNNLPRADFNSLSRQKMIERLRVAISEQREEAVPNEGEEDVAPMDAILQAALYEATESETAETVAEAVETALNGYIEELEMAVAVVRQMKEKNNG